MAIEFQKLSDRENHHQCKSLHKNPKPDPRKGIYLCTRSSGKGCKLWKLKTWARTGRLSRDKRDNPPFCQYSFPKTSRQFVRSIFRTCFQDLEIRGLSKKPLIDKRYRLDIRSLRKQKKDKRGHKFYPSAQTGNRRMSYSLEHPQGFSFVGYREGI